MTKRVLAFLMVMAMVLSLVPTVVLAEEAAVPGYTMIMQKAHNQTEGSLAIDIYLQANTAEQADVTGYQFTVTPAEGIAVTSAIDATGNDNLKGNENTFIYDPTAEKPIAVGTGKVLVATITVTGETLPATLAAAATIAEAKVTQAEGFFSSNAAEAETEGYLGAVAQSVVEFACTDHECAHGTGEWIPVGKAELSGKTLESGNYYLTEDVLDSKNIAFAKDAKVNICLNGYDIAAAEPVTHTEKDDKGNEKLVIDEAYKVFLIKKSGVVLDVCDCTATGAGETLESGKLIPCVSWGGALDVSANADATVNFCNVTIDGSATDWVKAKWAGGGIYLRNNGGTFTAEGVLFVGLDGYTANNAFYGPNILRGNSKGTYDSCTFVDCGTAILDANSGTGAVDFAPEMIVRDCVITDSREGAHAIDVKHNQFASVTIEGDCQFDVPVFIADPGSKETAERPVILDLGSEADFSIATTTEKTEEQLNAMFTVKNMTSKLYYENAVVYVTNVDGALVFDNAHTHEDGYAGISGDVKWIPWNDPTTLPSANQGYYYLTTDVTLTADAPYTNIKLCLNGHTIDASGTTRVTQCYSYNRTFCDCQGHENPENRGTMIAGSATNGSVFTFTSAGKNNGSKLYLYDIKLVNSSESNNSAIYVPASTQGSKKTEAVLVMDGVEASGFTAANGPVVRLQKGTDTTKDDVTTKYDNTLQLTIRNCNFHDNTSTGSGGVLYLVENPTVVIENTIFHNNQSLVAGDGGGGAIYSRGADPEATIVITDSIFTDNKTTAGSKACGGALNLGTNNSVTIDGCVFTGNETAASAGGAIYVVNDTNLTLKDTTITGNTAKNNGGGVYMTSVGSKLYLSGKVVIADNVSSSNKPASNINLFFQKQAARTEDLIFVNELTKGSHVEANYPAAWEANVAVQVGTAEEGATATQTDWDCGWITIYDTDKGGVGKNVSRVDGEFTYGHYHTAADGSLVEYMAWTKTDAMPTADELAAANGHIYLTCDVTLAPKTTGSTNDAYVIPGNIDICLNGNEISATGRTIEISNVDYTLTLDDCTAYTDAEGAYTAGGITVKNSIAYGAVRINNGGFIMKGGRIHDISLKSKEDRASMAVYVPQNATKAKVHLLGGEIANVDFDQTSNRATWAGLISIRSAPEVTEFKMKDFVIRDCDISVSGAVSGDVEGALIRIQQAVDVEFDNVLFENNTATIPEGTKTHTSKSVAADFLGMIYLKAASQVTMNNTKFVDNVVSNKLIVSYTDADGKETKTNGGATGMLYFAVANASLTGDNNEFIGNKLYGKNASGAAIYTPVAIDIEMTNSTFAENHADVNAAAIYSKASSTIDLTGCTFTDNHAGNSGGAFYGGETIDMKVTECTFTGNSSGAHGGVLYTSSSAGKYAFDSCDFVNNSATKAGGALCLNYFHTASVTGSTFERNTAGTTGAAIHLGGSGTKSDCLATIGGEGEDKVVFTDNTAEGYGGAIYAGAHADGSQQYIATNISNIECVGNSSKGGAVYVRGASGKANHTISNAVFTGNIGVNTSALMAQGAPVVNVSDVTITGNTSEDYGALHAATASLTMTLEGKIVVTDNICTKYAGYAETCDLYYQQYNNTVNVEGVDTKVANDAKIDMSGLTEGSKIGIHVADNRCKTTPVLTTNGGAAVADYLFVNCPERFLMTEIDGEVALVKHIAADGTAYGSIQAAIEAAEAAGETTFKLQTESNYENLTFTTMKVLDLNGFDAKKIIIANDNTLSLMDSATNDYDISDGVYGVVKAVECAAATEATDTEDAKAAGVLNSYYEDTTNGLKRYVTIADEDGTISVHRVYLAITTKVLRTANNGVGFKAIFAGDEVVTANQDKFGIQIALDEGFNTTFDGTFTEMTAGIAGTSTPNQKTIILRDVLKEGMPNEKSFVDNIYGRPYIVVGEEVVYGTAVKTTMSDLVDAALANGSDTVKAAVEAMLAEFGIDK